MKKSLVEKLIREALKEDRANQDITTRILIPSSHCSSATILFKSKGVVCGHAFAKAAFKRLDPDLKYKILATDGKVMRQKTAIAEVKGKTRAILSAERTALNFLGRLSGIASLTHCHVQAVKNTSCKILDTRKTTPTLREIERYAVACGGGTNHRFDLSSMVMIKDNHRLVCERKLSIAQAIDQVSKKTKKKIVVEVDTLDQLAEALLAKPDIILLDNMSPRTITQAVQIRNRLNKRVKLEASGGITLRTVQKYAVAGVDRISLGALTHSATCCDVSLEIHHEQ